MKREGRASIEWELPGKDTSMGTELCTQEAGRAVVGYEGKMLDEVHPETRME